MITMYGLTDRGIRIAKNPRNPKEPSYEIIAFLNRVPRASKEMISEYCGLNETHTGVILRKLKSYGIIAEESGVNV